MISKYWSRDENERFKYELQNLKNEYGISLDELNLIVEKYSSLIIKQENCSLCHSNYNVNINNRNHFKNISNQARKICDSCKTYSPNYIGYSQIDETDLEFQYAEISEMERFILKGMINLKSKMLIYKHIFNNDLEDRELWKIINNLEKKGLIYIERTSDCKIKGFKFPFEVVQLVNKQV
ncbi:hypothetical protein D1818_02180 [Aquimarina sp. BL5]|nr:hypothetical protein D1818_02180 [Aquimarina sp. BL5]